MAPRLDYIAEVGQVRAGGVIADKLVQFPTTNQMGCYLFLGSVNTDGYGQIFIKPNSRIHLTGKSAQKGFLIHVLAFISINPGLYNINDHISHLCDVRNCFNPAHLVSETPQANNNRKGCVGSIRHTGCGKVQEICTHSPRCIRIPKAVECCT